MKQSIALSIIVVCLQDVLLCAGDPYGAGIHPACTEMIPMRDGIRLAADIYLPAPDAKNLPAILVRTPYDRKRYNNEYGKWAVNWNYAAIIQDMRGRFDSEGEALAFLDDGWSEKQDGADTVNWICRQPFCNGKVGTAGASAMGITQELLGPAAPPEPQVILPVCYSHTLPQMYYGDDTYGKPFAKDPDVVAFRDKYYMYYSMKMPRGYAVGIATSQDLITWEKAGELLPGSGCDKKGLAAPAAIILDEKVHLFYQSYGNGPKDAICHAVSDDGITFVRNPTNPVFRPTGKWNCGRAIDADVIVQGKKLLLYWATRDPTFKTQMTGVSSAPLGSDYGRDTWTQMCDKSILKPELPWEKQCIEAPAVVRHDNRLFMFYAGAYNNQPQQIGCAVSSDGIIWKRLSDHPLLPNGSSTEWNSSESGHPGIFTDNDGRMYLFFQGNNDRGRTWFLSKMHVEWKDGTPYLIRPGDKKEFHLGAAQK